MAGVRADGRTVLSECMATYPLQVTRPREIDGRLELIVLLQSGGLLDGDRAAIDVWVERGACLALRTQAATQIHAGCSAQSLNVHVEDGAAFSYVPHALVPHAGADFWSETRIQMEPGARVLCAEVLSPGRVTHGEEFVYSRVRLHLDAWCGATLIARERSVLVPVAVTRCAQFGRATHVATAYVLGGKSAPPTTVGLELSELARGGWFVRGLAQRAADLDCALSNLSNQFWSGS